MPEKDWGRKVPCALVVVSHGLLVGGGPWRAGGDRGKSDTGLTERGRGKALAERHPPGGSYARSGSGRASLPHLSERASERRVMAAVMVAVARTAPVKSRSERFIQKVPRRNFLSEKLKMQSC